MKRQLTRRDMLRATAGIGLGLAAGCATASKELGKAGGARRPNILFLMVDEMRWDVMGCAGHRVVRTPNLDRLARDGVRFANSYSVAPVCCPARRTLFTGRYAHVHGVTGNGMPANDGELLLPSLLRFHGYTTAVSGKLHFDPVGSDYGFDYFWSYGAEGPGKLERYPEFMKRKHGSPTVWPKKPGSAPWPDDELGRDVGEFAYAKEDFQSYWITDRAIEFLRAQKNSGKPWFLFWSQLIPHSPYTTAEPYHSMYPPDSFDVPKLDPKLAEERAKLAGKAKRHIVSDEAMLRAITAQYYGHVTNVDDNVGRLMAELEKLGMADDTIVVFTADHGNMLGDRGRMFKGVMYEGSSHIPHLMRAPKTAPYAVRFNTGRVVEDIIESADIMPTVLDMAGLPIPEPGVQGKSFLKLVTGEERNWKNRCFAALRTAMLRTAEFKLIDNSGEGDGPYELYNMLKDPKEQNNLAGEAQYKTLVAGMARQIKQWKNDRPAPFEVPGMPTPDYAYLSPQARARTSKKAGKAPERKKALAGT